MNAVVTGAAGFLGRRVVRLLREDGLRVTCLVRPASDLDQLRQFVGPELWPGVDIQYVDLMDVRSCRRALYGSSVVYHLAAGITGGSSTLFLNSVIPTRRLLAAAAECGVQRFVHVSSLGVYGTQSLARGDVLDENVPMEPHPHLRDPYTFSKVVQERVVWEAREQSGVPVVVIRPGVIFGPGRGVLSSRMGLQVGPYFVRLGGDQQLPYTYVDNCADAVRNAGLISGIDGEVFNVVDSNLPTAHQLYRMCRRAGVGGRSLWVPRMLIQPLAGACEWYHDWSQGQIPGVLTRYRTAALWKPLHYVNDKAKSLLHWSPAISFAEAFDRTIAGEASVN